VGHFNFAGKASCFSQLATSMLENKAAQAIFVSGRKEKIFFIKNFLNVKNWFKVSLKMDLKIFA
jgi:hypothetical protein